jgi:integral membrane protein (TIGR01906 family)
MDIKLLNIVENSGLSKEAIVQNYDALIDYSSPFFFGDLKFPTLAASPSGLQHFVEVKNIFTSFYILGFVTFIIGIIIIFQKKKKKEYNYFLVSAITSIVLPLILGIYMYFDFDRAFVVFHKIFFKNDYWLFDPATDPVITILPDTFFLHCAVMIIVLVLLFSVAFVGIYLWNRQHNRIKYRTNKGLKL